MSFLLSISMISNFSGSILNLASTWFDILCVLCVFVGNLLGLFAVRAIALWDHQHCLGLDQLIHLSLNSGHLRIWKLWDLAPHSSTSRCESDTLSAAARRVFCPMVSSLCLACVHNHCAACFSHKDDKQEKWFEDLRTDFVHNHCPDVHTQRWRADQPTIHKGVTVLRFFPPGVRGRSISCWLSSPQLAKLWSLLIYCGFNSRWNYIVPPANHRQTRCKRVWLRKKKYSTPPSQFELM